MARSRKKWNKGVTMSGDELISTDPHNDMRVHKDAFGKIEQYGVQFIPEDERKSKL